MELSGGSLTRPAPLRDAATLFPIIGLALALGSLLILLQTSAIGGPLLRVIAAGAAAVLVHRGWLVATGRERQVRWWLAAATGIWFISEAARLLGAVTGYGMLVAELSLIGLGITATGSYIAAARGRLGRADETGLYLDAITIFATIAGGVIVVGAQFVGDPQGVAVLAHAAFFLAILAATLLLNVAVRLPVRPMRQWWVLVGLGLGALGYLALLPPSFDTVPRSILHGAVATGAVLVGFGGSRWSALSHAGPTYTRVATLLRSLMPMTSLVANVILVIALITAPTMIDGSLRFAAAVSLTLAVVTAVARQTILLADRERVLDRERRLTDELTVAEAQYRSVVERVPGVVYVAEAGHYGRWHFVSPKIADLLGYTPEEWLADPKLWLSRIHPTDRDRMMLAEIDESDRVEEKGRWEYRLIARDGRVVWVIDDEAVVARDADGRPTMVQGILVDISDRKHLEEQLRHQALHDPLTALPNRVLFVDRLTHALVRRNLPAGVAVLFVDLDDFKDVNDTLGHAAGDELLRLVADRLSGVLRAEDTACRLGGDEFAFLLEDADRPRAEAVAARILAALAEPFTVQGQAASLSASIGIATRSATADRDPSEAAEAMLHDADTAMYVAKSQGSGLVEVFERGMEQAAGRRRELKAALERALDAGDAELFLEYQPIIDMRQRALVGLEALVRWNHPQLGRLTPAEFVPLAEEARLIGRLGSWVLRRACADLADTQVSVSVNISAHQLGERSLAEEVEAVLVATGLPASRLVLELTESTLASAGVGAETELARIQRLGVRIALDDFGSGYSSLEYLGRLPIDILKVDRSLVERVHLEPQRQEVMRAVGHIAEKLALGTIVEGVELEAQRDALLGLGFRRAQGFLFSRPVPLADALSRFAPEAPGRTVPAA